MESDAEFIAFMSGELMEEIEDVINLAAERQNQPVSMEEFAGNFI